MPGALLGAATCGRCGATEDDHGRCRLCHCVWVPATAVDLQQVEHGALIAVVPATIGRRLLAHLVDTALVLVPLGVGIWRLAIFHDPLGWLLIGAAALVAIIQLSTLLVLGRSAGRGLLGVRAVDDLTGAPVRARRWLRSGRRIRFLAADLRHGRDPWRLPAPLDRPGRSPEPALAAAGSSDPQGRSSAGSDLPAVSLVGFSAPDSGPRSSVGIVTENGDRHDIEQVLLVGRSPVDPHPGPGRALLAWPDLSRRLAKTHLMLEWSGTVLWVTDLESLTGTSVATPDGTRVPLAPGVRFAAGIGSVIFCGGRNLTVVPGV